MALKQNYDRDPLRFVVPNAITIPTKTWILPTAEFRGTEFSLPTRRLGVVLHYPGANELAGITDVISQARAQQASYLRSRGYSLGYNSLGARSGAVCIVRGLYRSAANGNATVNNGWFAHQLLIDKTDPVNLEQILSTQRLIHHLRTVYGYGIGILGHRDLNATACPSDIVYEMIREGVFEPKPETWPENTFNPDADRYGVVPTIPKPELHGGEGPGHIAVGYLQGVLYHRASQHQLAMPTTGLMGYPEVGAVLNLRAWFGIPLNPGEAIVSQRVWDIIDILATQ